MQNVAQVNNVGTKKIYVVPKVKIKKKALYEFFKRIFDIVASLMALIVLAVPMLIVYAIIKFDSPGSPIYKQERLGLNGKAFTLYKFRTMHVDAESDGARWADDDDERCTRAGRILRKCRFDELPQLINILKGDMSIVGPRPERECFYNQFEEYINGFHQRLRVMPGLTGLAQVNGGYDLKPEEKIVYDIEYIKTRCAWLDIKIIFKTIAVVFNHNGAR